MGHQPSNTVGPLLTSVTLLCLASTSSTACDRHKSNDLVQATDTTPRWEVESWNVGAQCAPLRVSQRPGGPLHLAWHSAASTNGSDTTLRHGLWNRVVTQPGKSLSQALALHVSPDDVANLIWAHPGGLLHGRGLPIGWKIGKQLTQVPTQPLGLHASPWNEGLWAFWSETTASQSTWYAAQVDEPSPHPLHQQSEPPSTWSIHVTDGTSSGELAVLSTAVGNAPAIQWILSDSTQETRLPQATTDIHNIHVLKSQSSITGSVLHVHTLLAGTTQDGTMGWQEIRASIHTDDLFNNPRPQWSTILSGSHVEPPWTFTSPPRIGDVSWAANGNLHVLWNGGGTLWHTQSPLPLNNHVGDHESPPGSTGTQPVAKTPCTTAQWVSAGTQPPDLVYIADGHLHRAQWRE